jgi:hypothetical protein
VAAAINAEISNAGDIAAKTGDEALATGMTQEEVNAIEDAIADEFLVADQPRDALVKMWRKITKTLKERINERKRSAAQNARATQDQVHAAEDRTGNEAGREDNGAEGRAADPEAGVYRHG